eukprot:gnl/TRDRNA2_/TRDRNA2_38046_c0_seq1.p1 gnl/TRDRNA2_/TRDRNA2_38046_c0~~gnl/TRDRNA2_/TRDRNA2_38046_c0_seq1.p1  ORF type:complete len:803 (-),score=120.55 gnl/TRDRNA2_/TRDRNA2_38046_c0_seq1:114-2522(-)
MSPACGAGLGPPPSRASFAGGDKVAVSEVCDAQDPRKWSESQLCHWMRERGLPEQISRAFEEHLVNGLVGEELSEADLNMMGITAPLHQRRVVLELRSLFRSGDGSKAAAKPPASPLAVSGGAVSGPPAPQFVSPVHTSTSAQAIQPSSQSAQAMQCTTRSQPFQTVPQTPHCPEAPRSARAARRPRPQSARRQVSPGRTTWIDRVSPYHDAVPRVGRPRPRSASAVRSSCNDLSHEENEPAGRGSHAGQPSWALVASTTAAAAANCPPRATSSASAATLAAQAPLPAPIPPKRPPPQAARVGAPGFECDSSLSRRMSLRSSEQQGGDGTLPSASQNASLMSSADQPDITQMPKQLGAAAQVALKGLQALCQKCEGLQDGISDTEKELRECEMRLEDMRRERDNLREELAAMLRSQDEQATELCKARRSERTSLVALQACKSELEALRGHASSQPSQPCSVDARAAEERIAAEKRRADDLQQRCQEAEASLMAAHSEISRLEALLQDKIATSDARMTASRDIPTTPSKAEQLWWRTSSPQSNHPKVPAAPRQQNSSPCVDLESAAVVTEVPQKVSFAGSDRGLVTLSAQRSPVPTTECAMLEAEVPPEGEPVAITRHNGAEICERPLPVTRPLRPFSATSGGQSSVSTLPGNSPLPAPRPLRPTSASSMPSSATRSASWHHLDDLCSEFKLQVRDLVTRPQPTALPRIPVQAPVPSPSTPEPRAVGPVDAADRRMAVEAPEEAEARLSVGTGSAHPSPGSRSHVESDHVVREITLGVVDRLVGSMAAVSPMSAEVGNDSWAI